MKNLFRLSPLALIFLLVFSSCSQKDDQPVPVNNVIFLIGDGMGLSHVYAGMTANHGHLNLEKMNVIGLAKTYCSNKYITDSGASGTALATGTKTYYQAIGVNPDTIPVKSILEYAEEAGKATGLVATSSITHATPASFFAHESSRNNYEAIAEDFLDTEIDVVIGGGYDHFAVRSDSVDLTVKLQEAGYQVITSIEDIEKVTTGRLVALIAPGHPPKYSEGRNDMLTKSVTKSLDLLSQDPDGFFLMVEGSQIDWAAHAHDVQYLVEEMIDFDKAIAVALDFADANPGTLVVVTADHETGGLGINGGNIDLGHINGAFTTTGHTGVMVPVFAYGDRAEIFSGIQENTDIFVKMMSAFGFTSNSAE